MPSTAKHVHINCWQCNPLELQMLFAWILSIVYEANHLEKKHWCAQDHWGSFRSWNPSNWQLNFQALSWALSKPDSMSIMRSFMRSKSGFHCSSKVRIRRLCWENDNIEFLVLSQCKDMQRHELFRNLVVWSQQATRALSWVHSLIHPVQAGSEARKWINSWTRVRQLTKRLGGKQVYWVFSSDGNSEISHLLKLRNLPEVLPRQHLEPQKHEAYVRNFNHLPNDFPKFAYKHWHSITNFYLLHTIYIQVNDLWDASTEPLNNSCFLESWRSYLWYALGKSSGHAFGSGSEKLYTVVLVQ